MGFTMANSSQNRQRGASLVEALMTLGITAVLLGTAVPGLSDMRDRQRLQAATAQFETDVQHARSMAVARNQVLRLSFGPAAGAGCYVLHTGTTSQQCQCSADPQASQCSGGAEVLRTISLPTSHGISLLANVGSMAFEPHRGTVTPTGTIRVTEPRGQRVHLVINVMGRVRACTPNGATGWAAC